jgi:hypothetical protein
MTRFATLAAALATSATLIASAAWAQPAGYYAAVPAQASAKTALMTRATAWTQKDGTFLAARAPERDMILCQLVAKDVGPLASFSAGGQAYDAARLAQCNSKARVAATAVAAR